MMQLFYKFYEKLKIHYQIKILNARVLLYTQIFLKIILKRLLRNMQLLKRISYTEIMQNI